MRCEAACAPRTGSTGHPRQRVPRAPRGQDNEGSEDARRRLELAHALDHDHEPVRDAIAAGTASEEQAAVIVTGVDAVPVEHRR